MMPIISLLVGGALLGCSDRWFGRCTQTMCEVTAEITAIAAATDAASGCLNEPMEVRFATPFEGTCLALEGVLTIYGPEDGYSQPYPPQQWVIEQNLTVGSMLRAIVYDNGPCPPALEFPDLDFESAQQLCEQ